MSVSHDVAVIAGDGIGAEVVPAALQVLEAVGRRHAIAFRWDELDWGCARHLDRGELLPPDGLDRLAARDAILLGAVGDPRVPDHVSLWGLLIPIRRRFEQYVNLRPVRLMPGTQSPLRDGTIDVVVVRENTEGEYSEVGGRLYRDLPQETAIQEAIFTRHGTDRVMEFAFELAARRSGRLTSATKSNGIVHTMPFWDERFAAAAERHPDVATDQLLIDAFVARVVLTPQAFDVIVASNLFGDILSDLTAAVAGSIGIAPSANLNPDREHPSMFEPVHGSAPDIAGRGIANPAGQIWSAALMLEHLGHPEAAVEVERALEQSLADPATRTRDLGGTADTARAAQAVVDALGTE